MAWTASPCAPWPRRCVASCQQPSSCWLRPTKARWGWSPWCRPSSSSGACRPGR